MKPSLFPRLNDYGISEVQGTLVLIAVVVLAVILAKSTIGDGLVSAALDFGQFRAWGGHNNISYTKSAPGISITFPVDGSSFYSDEMVAISGSVTPADGHNVTLAYYRLNGGPWKKADISNGIWTGAKRRFIEGSYHVEAIAYGDNGDASDMASSTFETEFRPYPDSRYVNDNIPKEMTAGESYNIRILYMNTGYLSWNDTAGYSLSPYGSTFPGITPISIGSSNIQPGRDYQFATSLTAPSAPGEYTIGYMMQCSDFGWFGDQLSKNVTIVASYHDAKVVSMDMPSEMEPGETRDVSITIQNTGTASWYTSGMNPAYLWMVDGDKGDAYKFNGSSDRILMAPTSVIKKDGQYVFKFKIKAPSAGSYYTQYRMMWDGKYAFGQIAGCTINVRNKPQPTPQPTEDPYIAYNAHGNMVKRYINGAPDYLGPVRYFYDGPLGKHFERSSSGATLPPNPNHCDWDIGGPNGNYRIYNDIDDLRVGRNLAIDYQFGMNNGGYKGQVVFYQ